MLRRSDLLELPPVDFVNPGGPPPITFDGGWPQSLADPDDRVELEPAGSRDAQLESAYQRGWKDGSQAAIDAATSHAIKALESAAARLEALATANEGTRTEAAVDLALELARLVVGREVATAADPGRDAILRCLQEVTAEGHMSIRLNPDDLARLGDRGSLLAGRSYDIVADPATASGDAVVDVDGGRVDATLAGALDRVAEALRS